jgi:predicted exporter
MRAISSYHYAAANAGSIEADMKLILPVSFAALAGLTLLWLRSWRGLSVLFFPPLIFTMAWGGLDMAGISFSGISIGFGAVLLGIVIDYAIHSFYAWSYGLRGAQITGHLLRPFIYIFATSLGAFLPLLFSSLPGLRQMGVLTMVTLALGASAALFILPQLWGGKKCEPRPEPLPRKLSCKPAPVIILLFLVCALAYSARDIQMDGNLRSLGVRDQTLVNLEKEFGQRWGYGLRGSAFLQISGASENQVLRAAERVEPWLRAALPLKNKITDMLYIYPSPEQRQASLARWAGQIDLAALSAGLERAASELGYNKAVFNSFYQWLSATLAPGYAWPEDNPLLNEVRNILLPVNDQGAARLYMFFDDDEPARMLGQKNPFAEVVVVSPTLFAGQLGKDIKSEFTWLGLAALAGVVVLVLSLYRNIPMTLAVITPMLAGAAAILLYVIGRAQPLNLFAVAALPLLLGLSIDYGIFMVDGCCRANYKKSRQAVLLSALTTLAGFGSLILASHPALHSLGVIVSIGILGALPTAMLIPWLTRQNV